MNKKDYHISYIHIEGELSLTIIKEETAKLIEFSWKKGTLLLSSELYVISAVLTTDLGPEW